VSDLRFTTIGGPTMLIEALGLRVLTDPTFDRAGEYPLPGRVLTKLAGPAIPPEKIGPIDLVLLSHDQHPDNLDGAGREMLARVPLVITTKSGAQRLGKGVIGLSPGEACTFTIHGVRVRVIATPARHGPPDSEPLVGDVIGFLLLIGDESPIYISGDTVLYEALDEVPRYAKPSIGILHMGRASTRGMVLTMSAAEAADLAARWNLEHVVPVHYEGWAHFTEESVEAKKAFAASAFAGQVHWLEAGIPTSL
jgi:L-ascorbate metabolism protein UlaG (beta-lactamase superfamily)